MAQWKTQSYEVIRERSIDNNANEMTAIGIIEMADSERR